jgi:5-methylcytosine-specific restriction endonuclease McrA
MRDVRFLPAVKGSTLPVLKCSNCLLPQVRTYPIGGAELCARCAISEMILWDRDVLDTALELIVEKRICAYCGEYGEELEHVIAKCQGLPTWTVYACSECNQIAGGRLFVTFAEKREFIRRGLRRKYSKFLKMPEWTRDELDELADRLKRCVAACAGMRDLVLSRIQFDICIDELVEGSFRNSRVSGSPSSVPASPIAVFPVGPRQDK